MVCGQLREGRHNRSSFQVVDKKRGREREREEKLLSSFQLAPTMSNQGTHEGKALCRVFLFFLKRYPFFIHY
jgi:hypothetical protein